MGWKEMWEKYQTAAAFAEAGEHETARLYLAEDSQELPRSGKEERPARDQHTGVLRPSHAEG